MGDLRAVNSSIVQRLEAALGTHDLVEVADGMRIEGLSPAQVEDIFTDFLRSLLKQG